MAAITYNRRKAKGLCPGCGKNRKPDDGVFCQSCREKSRAKYRQKCMNETAEEKEARCSRNNQRQQSLIRKRRLQGLCAQCGAVSPLYFFCEVCKDKRRRARDNGER